MRLLPLRIALRYLVSKKSHTAVSVISTIAVCAVAVTALAMICVLSVFNGFHQLVDSKMSSMEPAVKVSAKRGVIVDASALIGKIQKVEGVEVAVPTVTESALVIYGNRQIPIVLKGITDDYDRLTNLKKLIKPDGRFLLTDGNSDYCIMSIGVALTLDGQGSSRYAISMLHGVLGQSMWQILPQRSSACPHLSAECLRCAREPTTRIMCSRRLPPPERCSTIPPRRQPLRWVCVKAQMKGPSCRR